MKGTIDTQAMSMRICVLELLAQVLEPHSAGFYQATRLLRLLLPSTISFTTGKRDSAGWRRLSFIPQTAEHKPDTAITIDA